MANPGVASSSVINLLPVQAEYDANGNCLGLYGQGGNSLQTPINATNLSVEGNLVISGTNPTLGSGWGTNPTILANNSFCFKVTVGPVPNPLEIVGRVVEATKLLPIDKLLALYGAYKAFPA